MFRLTIHDKPILSNVEKLGDRQLAMWLGQAAGGILHFTTYNYQNLNNGAGLTNVIYNVNHRNRHLAWHFVYYGYSRTERKIRGFV